MSSPKHERDSDRESLTDWTLVDREGTPDKTTREGAGKDDDKDSGKSSSSPATAESKEAVDKEKNESGGGTEEEEGEELSEDLISMGKRVQEIKGESIKASSGSDSSDIETLDCPSPDDCYEDSTQGYSSLHSSLLSSSLSGFTFVEEADEGDIESLASSDVMVLDQEGKGVDEETDLSLASSPSLPDDLPAIKPDTQYRHTPDRSLNSRLNVVVALTLACVLGLGLGHFLGWSSRSLWQENLNSAQVRRLRELQDDLLSCINSPPQVEPESGGPEYLPATTFIPVLTEAEAESAPNVETFVESIVVPLEEAGVVLDPGQQQHHHHHQGESHYTYHRHVHTDSMEPTFATLDLLHGSSDPAPALGQEPEARIRSSLPELSLATTAEDEIESPLPQPLLPMKTVEPTINEKTTPTASPTNTLPSIELNSEHESIPMEEQQEPILQFAEASREEDASSPVAVENSQIIEALNLENGQLRSEITRLQHENLSPIKISGKDGKNARNLRERITRLLEDNEELRVAVIRQQFAGLPEGDTKAFDNALGTNFKLRLSVGKLMHLVPDLTALKVSANDLQKENQELQKQVGKLRYQEQPLPQELNVVAREVESLKKVVDEASKKKKVPPNYENAKIYLTYMSQVLQTLHDFKEGGLVEKLDVATDVFEGLVPGSVKPSASVQQKLNAVRAKFRQLRSSLASKWEKIKELSRPQHLTQVSQDTLSKMNRVVVNVVNKMKDIGQASIMKRGKASLESTAATLAQSLAALGDQFDKTWKNLEAEVGADGKGNSGKLLIEGEDNGVQTGEEEEEIAVDDGEGEAEEMEPKDAGDEASEITTHVPNKSKKVDGKSGGSGGGGKGGGRGGGRDGDDKTDPEEKDSSKEKPDKKKEDKPDGRRDRSRRSRMSDKKEEKEEQKEKKSKGKEEKAKKKKDKENKKSKKDKDDSNKNRKSKDKEESSHMKKDERSKESPQQDDKRYHKGQYNKYDKKQQHFDDDDDDSDGTDADDENNYKGKLRRKYHKKKQIHEDDDDDKFTRKYQQKVIHKDNDDDDDVDDEDDKKKGLLRHWEKPSRKNYRREYPGPKKAFIRRRGKNATAHLRDEDGEWMGRRATGREVRRKEDQKADWLFERARHRSQKRESEHKADWQFDRAKDRREKRIGGGVDEVGDGKPGNYERHGYNRHEGRQAKRRYVRFGDDDDDDDDFGGDDYEFYHRHHHHHHHHQERGRGERKHHNNKGKREWVIPDFSATGKTFYH